MLVLFKKKKKKKKKKNSNDVKKDFVGVFPSNCVIRLITFHSMMTKTGARYPFIIMNADHSDKKAHIGGVFWIYIQKKKSFYLAVLVLRGSKNFYCKAIEKR